MSAVVEFVSDVVSDVVDVVGDVVEDVADFVVDVVDTVGDVVQAVIDDPLPVLLAIGGQMIGIPAPVTMGALTAARGGDLEDIALSMGTAYFAPQIGSAISSTVSSTFIEAGLNETFSQVAGRSISQGLVNGTVAEIRGGSFDDGFAGGFTGGMVAGGVSEVASYVKPDIIELAQESGLNLQEANTLYNAGTRAFSAGITAEVSGNNDFATAFTNSAISSGVDSGVRSLNATIDEQFKTAATEWNKNDDGETIDTAITGAGIPNETVDEVAVSNIGVQNEPDTSTFASAEILPSEESNPIYDFDARPETLLADAPEAESAFDLAGLLESPSTEETNADALLELASNDIIDYGEPESLDEDNTLMAGAPEPKGALASMTSTPSVDLSSFDQPAVVSEAPIANDLLTAGLAKEEPVGGLNAVAQVSPDQKMAADQGFKATDFTRPLVATVGNLLKQTLTQKKRPPPRAPARPTRPTGGLQMARTQTPRPATPRPASSAPAPTRMDVANLIPIQKAAPTQRAAPPTRVAPPKTLASGANLTPITDIASLTSLVKKEG
jgi:hypothetical protein